MMIKITKTRITIISFIAMFALMVFINFAHAIGPINVLPYIGSYPVTCGWHASCAATPIAGKGVDFSIGGQNGLTIYASADGIVHRATYNADDGGWGRQVIIRTADGSGGCYYHRYAHFLGTYGVFVREGSVVGKGTPIGYADNTGNSTGPHLHYHVYHTSSCNTSYTDLNESVSVYPATDTEPLNGYNSDGSLRSRYYYRDFPPAFQSSGSKQYENYSFPFSTKVTDDGDIRFSVSGSWTTQQAGFDPTHMNNRDMRWVYNVQSGATASATWRGGITSIGFYEIYAFIPSNYATTTRARYRVFYYDPSSGQIRTYDVYVNQNNYYNQWVSLGSYCGSAADYPRVTLYNDTGEPSNTKRVGADAMMWVRVGNNCPTFAMIPPQGQEGQIRLDLGRLSKHPIIFQPLHPSEFGKDGLRRRYNGQFYVKDQLIYYSLSYPSEWFIYPEPAVGSVQIQNFPREGMLEQGVTDMGGAPQVKIQVDFVPCEDDGCPQFPDGELLILSDLPGKAWVEYDQLFNLTTQTIIVPIGSHNGALEVIIHVSGKGEISDEQKMAIGSVLGSLEIWR